MIETTWHIAIAEPRQDSTAKFHLERAGFVCLAPWCHVAVRRRKGGQEKRIVVPMRRPVFPRYVFFGVLSDHQLWNVATRCRGVREVLMATDKPAVVRQKFISSLMSRCDASGHMRDADDPEVQERIDNAARYAVGDSVKFVGDVYSGLIAIVSAVDGRGYLEVEMTIFGSSRAVKVDPASVLPAAE